MNHVIIQRITDDFFERKKLIFNLWCSIQSSLGTRERRVVDGLRGNRGEREMTLKSRGMMEEEKLRETLYTHLNLLTINIFIIISSSVRVPKSDIKVNYRWHTKINLWAKTTEMTKTLSKKKTNCLRNGAKSECTEIDNNIAWGIKKIKRCHVLWRLMSDRTTFWAGLERSRLEFVSIRSYQRPNNRQWLISNSNVTIKQISSLSNHRRCHDNWKQSICCLRQRRKKRDFTRAPYFVRTLWLIRAFSRHHKVVKAVLMPRAMWLRIGRAIMYNNWVYERIKIFIETNLPKLFFYSRPIALFLVVRLIDGKNMKRTANDGVLTVEG